MTRKNLPTVVEASPVEQRAVGGALEGSERFSREMFSWRPALITPDQQNAVSKDMSDLRTTDMVQNDGLAMGAVNTHRDSIVGSQYLLNAQPDYELLKKLTGRAFDESWYEDFQQHVESKFNLLADSTEGWFDAAGTGTLTDLIRLGVTSFFLTGEVLATVEWLKQNGRPFQTAIQMVAPIRLSNPDGRTDDRFLSRGVEKDAYGAPIAYFIRMTHPAAWNDARMFQWKRVPAYKPWGRRQVIHIREALQAEQTRGISDMVAVLKNMRMTKKFKEITLQHALVNASYAAAIESELPKEMVYAQMGAGGNGFANMLGEYMSALSAYVANSNNIAVDGVKMPHLFPGTKLNLQTLGTPGGIGTGFEESLLRHTAAALGLSYEEFSHDYTKTNYSSARASGAQTWKYMQARKKLVADRTAKMIYALWFEEEMNNDRIPLPSGAGPEIFYDPVVREALLSCSWIGASRGQIDELKETQSAVMRINSGLSTCEEENARLGQDWRRVFQQRSREMKLAEALGLELSAEATKAGANERQKTMKDNQEEDEL